MRAAPSGFDRDLEHAVALVLRRSDNRSAPADRSHPVITSAPPCAPAPSGIAQTPLGY
jgi:hypothetical protein